MKRTILIAFALMASVVHAQEPAPTPEKTDEIEELIEKIRKLERGKLADIENELQKILGKRVAFEAGGATLGGGAFILRSGPGTESMEGRWEDKDGGKGTYKLSSLSKGQYQLRAEKTGKDGETTVIEDKGSMAELRKKYSFISSVALVTVPTKWDKTAKFRFAPPAIAGPTVKFIKSLGISVRRPSKDLEYHLKIPTETAWIVESVMPNAKHGFKKFDLLSAADGSDLAELNTLKNAKSVIIGSRRGKAIRIPISDAK